jgi:ketosteroid isomerase-like protein
MSGNGVASDSYTFSEENLAMNEHPNAVTVRSAYEAMEKGNVAAFVALLDDGITWHESTPGFAGDYHGRDQVLALLGRVFQETGVQMSRVAIHDLLANDDHTVILHDTTMAKNGRSFTGQYVDIYHLRNGKLTEHWHLAVDPKADEEFFTR